MRKSFIAAALAAAIALAAGYAADASQHRKPNEPAQEGQQTAQPRPPPQATPNQDRPRRGPERGPVIVPYPGWPWWSSPYGYPPTPWRIYAEWETASVRLDVSPKESEVYVDRYFAGIVDDFDGIFQGLTLQPGPHLIEIRKSGYRSLAIELNMYPGQSITYRRTMEPSSDTGDRALSAPGFEEGAATSADYNAAPGDVRFDVTPNDAAIYADGFYAGIVDDFNGSQHLRLAPGRHHLSLRLDGFESADVDVMIDTGRSMTYRASLKRLD